MTRDYKEQEVVQAIQEALASLKVLARADVKKYWRSLSREEQFAAGRGLAFIDGVAKDPAKYFARAKTEQAWKQRANGFAQAKGLERVADAFYIVQSPKDLAMSGMADALKTYDLRQDAYHLFDAIQNWEYNRTSPDASLRYIAPRDADAIVATAKRFAAQAKIVQSHPVLKPFRQVVYGFRQQIQR